MTVGGYHVVGWYDDHAGREPNRAVPLNYPAADVNGPSGAVKELDKLVSRSRGPPRSELTDDDAVRERIGPTPYESRPLAAITDHREGRRSRLAERRLADVERDLCCAGCQRERLAAHVPRG